MFSFIKVILMYIFGNMLKNLSQILVNRNIKERYKWSSDLDAPKMFQHNPNSLYSPLKKSLNFGLLSAGHARVVGFLLGSLFAQRRSLEFSLSPALNLSDSLAFSISLSVALHCKTACSSTQFWHLWHFWHTNQLLREFSALQQQRQQRPATSGKRS